MTLPPGFIDELRTRVSLAQVVGRKVAWDGRKSNPSKGDYWAACPFHQEKSASFHVDDAKGYYYCFGCHAKGDLVTFVRETENLGFVEAIERLARDAGMTMPARDPAAASRAAVATGLADIMEIAVRFYRAQLNGAAASEARAYLDRRAVTQTTRDAFELGFAGPARSTLFEHLRVKGVAPARMVDAGLCVIPEDGGAPFDRFRDRILFPIRDARGRAIAFGGRAMAEGARAKYLNSPETALFDKGRTLYNIAAARAAAGKSGALVVVEGYMDVIALSQAGLPHVVAPLGTAVTADQLALMWRIAPEPVIALDGDAAGAGAARRLVDLALPLIATGKGLRFALMPGKQDPDDVIRTGGLAAFEALVATSRPMIDLIWERETEGAPLDSPERRAARDARLRAHLARIADPAIRAHYDREIRARLFAASATTRAPRFDRNFERKPDWKSRRAGHRDAEPPRVTRTRSTLVANATDAAALAARVRESAILLGCLNHPALLSEFEDRLERAVFQCPDLAAIRDVVLSTPEPGAADLPTRVAARLGDDPRPGLLAIGHLRASKDLGAAADPDRARRAIAEALDRHAASVGRSLEISDAERDNMQGDANEGLTWRLKRAAEASQTADASPLIESKNESNDESVLSLHLQNLIDAQIWKKIDKR